MGQIIRSRSPTSVESELVRLSGAKTAYTHTFTEKMRYADRLR